MLVYCFVGKTLIEVDPANVGLWVVWLFSGIVRRIKTLDNDGNEVAWCVGVVKQ